MARDTATKDRYIYGDFITQRCLKFLGQFLFHPEHSLKNEGHADFSSRSVIADPDAVGSAVDIFTYLLARSNYSHSDYSIITSLPCRQPDGTNGLPYDVINTSGALLNKMKLDGWINRLTDRRHHQRLIIISQDQPSYDKHIELIDWLPRRSGFRFLHIIGADVLETERGKHAFKLIVNEGTAFGETFIRFTPLTAISKRVRKEWAEALRLSAEHTSDVVKDRSAELQIGFGFRDDESSKIKCHWLFKL